jgi:hypothetical protein
LAAHEPNAAPLAILISLHRLLWNESPQIRRRLPTTISAIRHLYVDEARRVLAVDGSPEVIAAFPHSPPLDPNPLKSVSMFLDSLRDSIPSPANQWRVSNLGTVRHALRHIFRLAITAAYGELIQPGEPLPVLHNKHFFLPTHTITDSSHRAFQTADVILTASSTGAPLLWTRLNSLHLPSGLNQRQILAKSPSNPPTTQDEVRKAITRDYDIFAAGPTVSTDYTIYSHS